MGFSMEFATVKPESGMNIQQKGYLNSLVASIKVRKLKKKKKSAVEVQSFHKFCFAFILHEHISVNKTLTLITNKAFKL